MKKYLAVWLLLFLAALPARLFAQSQVDKIIHTDSKPSLIGEGIASLTKSGSNIEVAIIGLVLRSDHTPIKSRITGMQIGLLTPNQRAQRSGASYGKRIPMNWENSAGSEFELDTAIKETFPEEPGASLKDYHACLKIFVTHNNVSEAFIFAHTAKGNFHRDFFPLRKSSNDTSVTAVAPRVTITPPLQTRYEDVNEYVKRIRDGFEKAAQNSEAQQNAKIDKLKQGYLKNLEQVQKYYTDRANLSSALKVRAEIKRISGEDDSQTGDDSDSKGTERLQESRKLYEDARKKIEEAHLDELRRLVDVGNEALNKYMSSLTKRGDLDRVEALYKVIPTWHGRSDLISEPEVKPAKRAEVDIIPADMDADIEIGRLDTGVRVATNRNYTIVKMPKEYEGLKFLKMEARGNLAYTYNVATDCLLYALVIKDGFNAGDVMIKNQWENTGHMIQASAGEFYIYKKIHKKGSYKMGAVGNWAFMLAAEGKLRIGK